MEKGLEILGRIRAEQGVPVTTDFHLPQQAAPVAEVVDLLQVPAFLCRQTDLLVAAGQTGIPVNLKKGQFLAPADIGHAVAKLATSGAAGVLVTERGSSFGYNNLVVDMRSLPTIRGLGVPVCFDSTHSVQRPGGLGDRSDGDRELVPYLARAAVAAGVDAVFLEVHEDPDSALSDGPNMVHIDELPALLRQLYKINQLIKEL
jgi:2-dehydro-3-deoxyphosphooctonate aldolase (KDO 8-P synthase)